MNCAVCGKDNQPGTRFCVHCGASLAAVAPPASAPPRPTPAPSGGGTGATVARGAVAPAAALDTGTRAAMASPSVAYTNSVPAYEAEPSAAGRKILLGIGIAALVIAAG